MSRIRHIRKAIVAGIIEKTDTNPEGLSTLQIKIQPKWNDETGEEKLGRSIEIDVALDDLESSQKYMKQFKVGDIIYVEGELKTKSKSDSNNLPRNYLYISISRSEGSISTLKIKKEEDMPYINKIIIMGNATRVKVRTLHNNNNYKNSDNSENRMGIFTILTKKSRKDRMTQEIISDDHWLDVFVFNNRALTGFESEEGEKLSNKVAVVIGSIKSAAPKQEGGDKNNTISISNRLDNHFVLIDTINTQSTDKNSDERDGDFRQNTRTQYEGNNNNRYRKNHTDHNNQYNEEGTTSIDEFELPF